MFIRHISSHHNRFRGRAFALLLSGISIMSLQPAAFAQNALYAPELLGAEFLGATQSDVLQLPQATMRAISFGRA